MNPEWSELTIADVWQDERARLIPLPSPFDGYVEHPVHVFATSLIHYQRNRYSVPCEWKGVTFSSQVFREGLHEKLVRRGVEYVTGFTLSLVVRCVWVEIGGQIYELEPSIRIQSDRDDLLLPLSSLIDMAQEKSEVNSATREAAQASMVFLEKTVKAQTGYSLNAGKRRAGSPKKSASALAEAKALRSVPNAKTRRRA